MNKYNVGKVFDYGIFRCKIRTAAPGGNYLADCYTNNSHYSQVMRFDEATIDDLVSTSNRETDMSYGGGKRIRRRTVRRKSGKGRKGRTNKKRKTKGRRRL